MRSRISQELHVLSKEYQFWRMKVHNQCIGKQNGGQIICSWKSIKQHLRSLAKTLQGFNLSVLNTLHSPFCIYELPIYYFPASDSRAVRREIHGHHHVVVVSSNVWPERKPAWVAVRGSVRAPSHCTGTLTAVAAEVRLSCMLCTWYGCIKGICRIYFFLHFSFKI